MTCVRYHRAEQRGEMAGMLRVDVNEVAKVLLEKWWDIIGCWRAYGGLEESGVEADVLGKWRSGRR